MTLVAAMSTKHSFSAVISKRKHTSYNLDVKLNVIHCKQRGKHVIHTTHALQIPNVTICTILMSAQEIESKAKLVNSPGN